jgi:DNA replication protein DnaC
MFCRKAAHLNSHCQDYGNCPDYSSREEYGICIHETETRWILTMKRAGIEKRYWKIEFETLADSIKQTEAYRKAISYVQQLSKMFQHGYGFGLFGGNGVGKTSLLCCILKAVLRKGYSALLIEAPEVPLILNRWKTKKPEDNQGDSLEERLFQDDFLLLDDLGAESSVEYSMACIQQVVLRRVNEMKPILFTSDLTPEEMAHRWMQAGYNRVYDRLRTGSFISYLEGENLRERKACLLLK